MIGILHGEELGRVVVTGDEQIMRRPEIVIGPAAVIGVEGGGAFDDDRNLCGDQVFEGFEITAHAIFDSQPTRIIADPISEFLGVDVAVTEHGFDHI